MPESNIDWRARAVAHARALSSMLAIRPQARGTFGETWQREAAETIALDLNIEPFCHGHTSARKDGTLPPDPEEVAHG